MSSDAIKLHHEAVCEEVVNERDNGLRFHPYQIDHTVIRGRINSSLDVKSLLSKPITSVVNNDTIFFRKASILCFRSTLRKWFQVPSRKSNVLRDAG